jgi:hypothetical protein
MAPAWALPIATELAALTILPVPKAPPLLPVTGVVSAWRRCFAAVDGDAEARFGPRIAAPSAAMCLGTRPCGVLRT